MTTTADEFLAERRFGRFQRHLLIWCSLIIVFDGYDLIIYGVVLPLVMEQWQLTSIQAGLLGSSALLGMMVGAITFGTLADRLGRRVIILSCLALFSVVTVINGLATTPTQFAVCRFIAGLGLGGVMPNVVALVTEYSPRRLRTTLVAIMFSGYSIGGMLSAGLGILIVPRLGWEMMFFLAGVPLLCLPFMWRHLPESLDYLVRKGRHEEAERIAQQLTRQEGLDSIPRLAASEEADAKAPVAALMQPQRRVSTLMFWLASFMCLLMIYALGSWLPTLMTMAGYPIGKSLGFLLVMNLGAIAGAIGGGLASDRLSPRLVLIVFFVAGSCALALLGLKSSTLVLYALVAVAGAATIGAQILINAYVAQYYPPAIRSTAVGSALAVGRVGALAGPLVTGMLLSLSLPHAVNFAAFAVPGLIALVAVSLIGRPSTATTASPHTG
ncbi:MAG: aromatic acid/H+ symport family MFS transporter [Gammaproteobacteria bacterium]|nr:aromatic acid/H+ symport family MFS transporter [Gammaproteobacteria bacterium]